MVVQKVEQNLINHVGLVIDKSWSMSHLQQQVVQVVDGQVHDLAQLSQEMDQETRVTIYTFDDSVYCINYDKDVLRLPSLSGRYHTSGNTALLDATMKCITDLEKTATLYGDHAFLIFVVTDGQENRSRLFSRLELKQKLDLLPDNWTVVAFVPDARGLHDAETFGFLKGNIAIWDTSSSKGFESVGNVVRKTTQTFMQNRAQGIRGSRSILTADTSRLDTSKNLLTPLNPTRYSIFRPVLGGEIRTFVESKVGSYTLGNAYYKLRKSEILQPHKHIVVRNKRGEVFTGTEVRGLLGLDVPDKVRVHPNKFSDWDIFVQSTSVNRHVTNEDEILVLR